MPLVRTLHIYLSLAATVAILVFAVTGILMNHKEQLKLDKPSRNCRTGQFSSALLQHPIEYEKIVDELRNVHGLSGAQDPNEIEKRDDRLIIPFHRLAKLDEVQIVIPEGDMTITMDSWGVIGALGDLHKGQDAGNAWRWVIDAVGGTLILVALTGIALWLSLRTRRGKGAIFLILGTTLCVLAYLIFIR